MDRTELADRALEFVVKFGTANNLWTYASKGLSDMRRYQWLSGGLQGLTILNLHQEEAILVTGNHSRSIKRD